MEDRTDEGLRRDVGFFGLLWISAGTTLGSGWLFGAFVALTIAGPAALIGWVLAALFMAPLALVYAELGAMFPESGGPGRFAHHAFGSLAGATFGWFSYVQAATIAPIEVLAAIEYLSTNSWANGLYNASSGTLSASGYVVAVVLMGVFVTLNLLGIRLLSRANSAITVFKLAIPSLAAAGPDRGGLPPPQLHRRRRLLRARRRSGPPSRSSAPSRPAASPSLFMGFEGALEVGGESTHPQRDLPRAVFGAFVVCTLIYIAVQVAFIGALPPSLLSHYASWTGLATDPQLSRAPFFVLASLVGLVWLAWIMRVDAVVSPSGTGLLYLTGASRLSFGLSRDGYVPEALPGRGRAHRCPALGSGHVRGARPALPPALPELGKARERRDWRRGAHVRRSASGARVPCGAPGPRWTGPTGSPRPDSSPRHPSSSPPSSPTGRAGRRSRP